MLSALTKHADCKYAAFSPDPNMLTKKPSTRKRKRRVKSKLPLDCDSPNYSPGHASSDDDDDDDVEDRLDKEIKLRRCDSSSWRTG